jgi:putative oxidoreductase
MFNDTINNLLNLMGRLLLASVFLPGGVQKLSAYAGTQRYMKAMGVPGGLLPLVIALQIGGGLALIIGFKVPWAALALGGFLILASLGAGTYRLDARQN